MSTQLVAFAYRYGEFEVENQFLEASLNVRGGPLLNGNVLFDEAIGKRLCPLLFIRYL